MDLFLILFFKKRLLKVAMVPLRSPHAYALDFGTTRFFRILGLEKQCSILTRICTLF